MRRGLASGIGWLAVALAALPAAAQHPTLPSRPPLHERALAARWIVLAQVEDASEDRLAVRAIETLAPEGEALPERFQVKRAPSRPPALAVGSLAVLLLEGARSPFVLADPDADVIAAENPAEGTRCAEAVRALLVAAHSGRPEQLIAVYRGWLDAGPEPLRTAAALGLVPLVAGDPAAREALALDRADAALDLGLPLDARQASAPFAVATPAGAERLLAGLASAESPPDPALMQTALQAGAAFGAKSLGRAFTRAIDSDDAALRIAALRTALVVSARLGPGVGARVEALTHDVDPDVARQAARALRQLPPGTASARPAPHAGGPVR